MPDEAVSITNRRLILAEDTIGEPVVRYFVERKYTASETSDGLF